MSNIEDDLKEKGFIEAYKQIKNNASIIKSIDKDFFFELVDYLLSEREQDKARIKELEEKNRMLALEGSRVRLDLYIKGNYIPKQKIKEKINENSNMIREIEEKIKKEKNSGDICEEYLSDLYKEKSLVERDILTLQELLQESEDK